MMAVPDELDHQLGLRPLVGRRGRMSLSGWLNTEGQLGRPGSATLCRSYLWTHQFARALISIENSHRLRLVNSDITYKTDPILFGDTDTVAMNAPGS